MVLSGPEVELVQRVQWVMMMPWALMGLWGTYSACAGV